MSVANVQEMKVYDSSGASKNVRGAKPRMLRFINGVNDQKLAKLKDTPVECPQQEVRAERVAVVCRWLNCVKAKSPTASIHVFILRPLNTTLASSPHSTGLGVLRDLRLHVCNMFGSGQGGPCRPQRMDRQTTGGSSAQLALCVARRRHRSKR